MTRLVTRRAVAAAATALLSVAPVAPLATSASADQPAGYGPSDPFDSELMGDTGPVEPMKNQAKIVRTKHGYMITAGQQNSHLTISLANGKLRFHDTATREWRSLTNACQRRRVANGVAAECRIPSTNSPSNPTLLEVHPRLGSDYVDGRTLPATWEMAVLADAGRDKVFTGHGDDFVNGARDLDRMHGGAGRDWLRGGTGNDRIWGGDDSDYIVGQDGADRINGGGGKDRVHH